MNAKPIFIHSLFRSGSTYLFDVFRRSDEGYWCYQEPLNELLLNRSDDAFWMYSQQQDSMVDHLRHPKLDKPYYFEFAEIKEVVLSRFRPEFCYELFFLTPGQQADELSLYVTELVTHARGRAVLQCCRSIGRMRWARSKSDAVHIYLWRNPWDQWWSYKVDPYFDMTSLAVYGAKGLPDFLSRVRDESGLDLPGFQNHLPDWGMLQKEIALHADHAKSYLLFYALWVYGLLESRGAADVSMNIDMLSESPEYRSEVLARLSDLGVNGLDLSDADVPRSVFGKNDRSFFGEIEHKVHELLLKAGYDEADLDWVLAEREKHSPSRQKQPYETTQSAEAKLLAEDIFRLRKMIQRYGAEFQDKKNFALVLEAKAQSEEARAQMAEGQLARSLEQNDLLDKEVAESRAQSDHLRENLVTAQENESRLQAHAQWLRNEWDAAKAKVDELNHSSHHWWAVADQLNRELQGVYASKSWRITWPLRQAMLAAKWMVALPKRAVRWMLRLPKRMAKPLVVWAMRQTLANSGLKARALSVLTKRPQLKQRLREFAERSGLIAGWGTASPMSQPAEPSASAKNTVEAAHLLIMQTEFPKNLSLRAARIYIDLQKTSEARKT